MTKEGLLRRQITDAVASAFRPGTRRASDGSTRPSLGQEDCEHIAALAHRTVKHARLGAYGVRTINGGRK